MEEEKVCTVCSVFEPQAWRKSLCRNCFHTLEDHSEELLAAEAEAVAKEKAAAAAPKSSKTSPKADAKVGQKGKETGESKGKELGRSSSFDLGREYGKPVKKTPTKDSTPSTSSSSTSSATSTTKTSPKSTTTASTTATTTTTESKSQAVSKAKSLTSKFENKLASTADEAVSKPADLRISSTSVSAVTGKLNKDDSNESKSSIKAQKLDDSKSTDTSKSSLDSKAKALDSKSSSPKTPINGLDKSKDEKEKKDAKDSLPPLRSKTAAPFGKDMLKSTKKDAKSSSSSGSVNEKDSVKDLTDKKEKEPASLSKVKTSLTSKTSSLKSPTSSSPLDSKLKSGTESKNEDKVGNKSGESDSAAKSGSKAGSGVASSNLGQSSTLQGKSTSSSSSSSFTPSSSSVSPSFKGEEKADGAKINKTGQLAKYLPGKFGEGKESPGKPAADTGRAAQPADDVIKTPGKKDSKVSGDAGAQTSPGAKKLDKEKAPIFPDRDKDKGGGGGVDSKKLVGVSGDKSSSPKGTLSSLSDTKQSPTVSGQKDTGAKTTASPSTPSLGKFSSTDSSKNDSSSSTSSALSKTSDVPKPKDLRLHSDKGALNKFKELDKKASQKDEGVLSPIKSPSSTSSLTSKQDGKEDKKEKDTGKEQTSVEKDSSPEVTNKLKKELKEKEEKLEKLEKQLTKMEEEMKKLETEKEQMAKEATQSRQSQKEDMEKLLQELRGQLSTMDKQCDKLNTDNQSLLDKLHKQEDDVKRDQELQGKTASNLQLEEDLELAEKELEDVKEENKELQRLIMELKNEMDEMHDHFRENEHDEFRELQKELEMTAKNCRILQFKLRKAERRNEQIEEDRIHYEEKLRHLQDQFDSQDAKSHIQLLEEELRVAKEVSVRLHDELDIVEDKKNKALEENRHLTELLEHTDKRQFRLEMEIDKLRDIVQDLKMQLREAKGDNNNRGGSPDRKPTLATVGKQGSKEYDASQLMKDLCDSMERENDLKDQLKFSEEEAKMMRRRVAEMDEENENLRVQLQKISEKASKLKKKEKEREKELEEERKQGEAARAALLSYSSGQAPGDHPVLVSQFSQDSDLVNDVIVVVGAEGSDILESDEPIHVSERKDSTDEDLMNVMQLRVQLEMLEQELMTSHKKMDDMDLENENLQAEVKFLQERLEEKTQEGKDLPEPSTPNAYYEDKIKELTQELDDLRWKLIEKDREIERLQVVQTRSSRDHSKKHDRLKKSKSLDIDADNKISDLKRQLELTQQELIQVKKALEAAEDANNDLMLENEELKLKTPVPSVRADDAPLENIELREKVKKLEEENKSQSEKIKQMTEALHRLSKDTRTYATIATSPMSPGLRVLTDSPTDLTRPQHFPPLSPTKGRLKGNLHLPLSPLAIPQTSTAAGTGEPATALSINIPPSSDHEGKSSPLQQLASPEGKIRKVKGVHFELDPPTTLKDHSTLTSDPEGQHDGVAKPSAEQTPDFKMADADKTSGEKGDGGGGGDKSLKKKSLLLDYPDGRSKITTTGEESRVELMEKVLDMDDEISDLLKELRRKEDETDALYREVKSLKTQLTELKDESRRTELDLLQELDMLHDKNSVMSNLLDIINERAEAAEEELERRLEERTHSPQRSTSNVSQVSALSDTSTGSDEVFMMHAGGKEGVLTRDWESKLKVRIESLERLLAEERQKVNTAEKKLILAGIDNISPSVSDDVKLRMREKELLQEELLKSQRHLHIATDQIQGLKERVHILEEEYQRLKNDYAKLYDEIDKPLNDTLEPDSSDSDKTPKQLNEHSSDEHLDEHPFVAKKISVVEAPNFRDLKLKKQPEVTSANGIDISLLEAELATYKEKAKELEYQVEEINDIWRSKSAASDKEKDELEKQLKQQLHEMNKLEETVETLKRELNARDKLLAENQADLKQRENELSRKSELVREHEGENKKHDQDKQTWMNQLSQREGSIRDLNETIRIRDERLREKDDIICKLNQEIEDLKQQARSLNDKVHDLSTQVTEKEVLISVLRGQISPTSPVRAEESGLSFQPCQTDAEKENCRLREAIRQQQLELQAGAEERKRLSGKLEESQQATEAAALLWDEERGAMQQEMNVMEEKVRMYEAYNSMNKDDTIEALKQEAQDYFRQREALACQLSTLKLKHNATIRQHKEQVAKLQGELSEKLKELKAEVDNNTHLNTEMDRLNRQAELAYRLQQEERLLRAEHQAMKVRYESRIDKMNKEANKMVLSMTKLQKERDLDKEIIAKIQENFTSVREKYTEQLLRSEDDRAALDRHIKEIEESRGFVEQLQKQLRELREKCLDQDRLRSELINKFSTDRAGWEIERANLNSTINQMEEQLSCYTQQQARSKDIQVNMGMAWDKERREQRRLLQEAHTLALDLQEQLRSRDETFAHERKELLRQLEVEKMAVSKDKRDSEKRYTEFESCNRKVATLQKQLQEMESRAQRDTETWRVEKIDLLRQLAECKHAQSRDYRKLEEVMTGLSRLKELGQILKAEKSGQTPEQGLDQKLVTYIREAVGQISDACDELTKYSNTVSDDVAGNNKSETSSDKSEMSQHFETCDGDVIIATDVTTSRATTTSRIEEHATPISRKLNTQQAKEFTGQRDLEKIVMEKTNVVSQPPAISYTKAPESSDQKSGAAVTPSETRTSVESGRPGSTSGSQAPAPVLFRPFDATLSRRYDRPPSYTSGTRSANTSRATTPDMSDHGIRSADVTLSRRTGLPEPPPSFVIPHHRSLQPGAQQEMFQKALASALSKSNQPDQRTKRPASFKKSLSVDGPESRYYVNQRSRPPSLSANTTPTYPVTSADLTASFANQNSATNSSNLSPMSQNMNRSSSSLYKDKFSPRTARRKFFEEPNLFKSGPPYPWSDTGSYDPRRTSHHRQASLPDHDAVRREAEEIHDLVSSRVEPLPGITSSTSWDEAAITASQSQPSEQEPMNTDNRSEPHPPNVKAMSAKEKRKFFKKSSSLDSTVGTSIAKVGFSAISPGAPSGFTPSEIFAAVKGKLKPVFKRKSVDGSKSREARQPSPPLFIQTEVTDSQSAHFGAHSSVELPVPVPHVEISESHDREERDMVPAELPSERSRDLSRRSDTLPHQGPHGKWRSKSADRAASGPHVHGDVIRPVQGVWKFNETAV